MIFVIKTIHNGEEVYYQSGRFTRNAQRATWYSWKPNAVKHCDILNRVKPEYTFEVIKIKNY